MDSLPVLHERYSALLLSYGMDCIFPESLSQCLSVMPDHHDDLPFGNGPSSRLCLPFPSLRLMPAMLPVFTAAATAQDGANTGATGGLEAFVFAAVLLLAAVLLAAMCVRRRRVTADTHGLQSHRIDALQKQLIEREKLASLGQLTAGIAHEIKNPLNFVTNFSDLSVELLEELRHAGNEEEREEILAALRQNLAKISEHGHRADEIVRSMMLHARGGSTTRESADLNRLISESTHLAYHAMRAQQDGFNCAIDLELDEGLVHPPIVRQDIGRVLLNILQNAMQSVHARARAGEKGFAPRVAVSSDGAGGAVRVRIRDNGTGIPAEIREHIFEPFFTTKEADRGTGLGLSIAHEIIVDQHGGRITVEDVPGGGAAFVIELPLQADASLAGATGGGNP